MSLLLAGRSLTGRQIRRASRDQMIQPVGGSAPPTQTLNFRGHLTGRVHQDLLLCPPGYDPADEDTTYDLGVFWHGVGSSASNAAGIIRPRLQAHMGTTIRPIIALFPDGGDHSWYWDNVIATDTGLQAPGASPYDTMIRRELLPYAKAGIRWSGKMFHMTFSMGCQALRYMGEDIESGGLVAMMFTAGPRLRYDNGGPWPNSGGPPTTAQIFTDIYGGDPANPQLSARYIAASPQTNVIAKATTIKAAIAANRFRLRAVCGADDPTLIGHDLFRTGVLDAQGITYDHPANIVGADHNWIKDLDGDGPNGQHAWEFIEAALAAAA